MIESADVEMVLPVATSQRTAAFSWENCRRKNF